jgi:putative ABC transport system permease protein
VPVVAIPVSMESVFQDLRYAGRMFRRTPGVTMLVVLTLAFGIGATTAIFSFVDAILLTPLPYPHAGRIVGMWERRPTGERNSMTTLNYLDYANSGVFERIAATTICCDLAILSGTTPTTLGAMRVSPSYFSIFGAQAALGRTLVEGDDRPGRDHVIVFSHRAWVSHFGADPAAVGGTVRVSDEPYTIVGIMPEHSPFDRGLAEAWLPLTFDTRMNRSSHWLLSVTGGALGLLKPGVTIERARDELAAIAARLSAEYPATNRGWGVVVEPYSAIVVGPDLRRSLYLFLGAIGFVLLIVCVNVANLLLGRALTRDREIAVRLALGASRPRVVQQLLTESVLLAMCGGLLGMLVGSFMLTALKATLAGLPFSIAMLPMLPPAEASVRLDWRVLMFAAGLSCACGIAFGLAPAVGMARAGALDATARSGHSSQTATSRRLHAALIVVEVALAIVLLVNAGLLMRSFLNMRRADTGFDGSHVIAAALPVRAHRFRDADELRRFMRDVVERIRAIPGVIDAAFTDGLPLQGAPTGTFAQAASGPLLERSQRPVVDVRRVSPSYLRVLGLRLRRGRFLSEQDAGSSPLVTVVSESLARRFFGARDPLGERLLMDAPAFDLVFSGEAASFEIVGVVADERLSPLDDRRDTATVYVSSQQDPTALGGVVVRAALDPSLLGRDVRAAIAAIDKDQPVEDLKTVEQLKSESMLPDRLRLTLLALFAAAALLLSAVGIYGVISHAVVQRTREIGIRAALGAGPAALVRLVMSSEIAPVALGVMLGLIGSAAAAGLLRSFLFGVGSSDAATILGAVSVLTAVAAGASYVAARRAAGIDPIDALRAE